MGGEFVKGVELFLKGPSFLFLVNKECMLPFFLRGGPKDPVSGTFSNLSLFVVLGPYGDAYILKRDCSGESSHCQR